MALTFYDGPNGTGKLLGRGGGSTTVTIGQPFTVTVPVVPIVASLGAASIAYSSGSAFINGYPGTATLVFALLDPDNNVTPATATTTFAQPYTLSSNDPTVTVSPTTWTSSAQPITLSYSGSSTVGSTVSIRAVAGGTTVASAQVAFRSGAYTVSTLAGGGPIGGHADGVGTAATFHYPSGIAVGTDGTLYVADTQNNEIRTITPAGVVSTLAGSVTNPHLGADGTGSAAEFWDPIAVAVDGAGNVYVADYLDQEIRKITPGGVVTTLAGNRTVGSNNGTGSSATFNYPIGVAVDASGNVYVADDFNYQIRKITPAGVVTTLAGSTTPGHNDGIGAGASFTNPSSIAVDANGMVYVTDNNSIREITPSGSVTTLGTQDNGDPLGISVDGAGNIYYADSYSQVIRVVNLGQQPITPITIAGTAFSSGNADGAGAAATFNEPFSTAVDSSGVIYVVDNQNQSIRKITPPIVSGNIGVSSKTRMAPQGARK